MKVCHLTSVHSYNDTRIFIKECKALENAGYDVSLIVPGVKDFIENNIKIYGVDKVEGSRFKRMTKTAKRIYEKALDINADIYHFHDPELIRIGLKLKKKGKIVIYDVHEDVPRQILAKEWIPKLLRHSVSKVFEIYENKVSYRFDVVVTATSFIKERFKHNKCNAIDIKNYPLITEFEMETNDWSKKDNAVCYMGGITFVRGIKEMVRAMEISKGSKLLLAGNFAFPIERDYVINLDGWKNVCELGYLNRKEVKGTYKKSKAGLVTLQPTINYLDALPVKMFEYMAAGIPVIASNFPLWREIIEKNKCGICVDPNNPYEISKAIDWIMDNPTEAQIMGENGKSAVEKIYNWEFESKKLVNIYNNLIE